MGQRANVLKIVSVIGDLSEKKNNFFCSTNVTSQKRSNSDTSAIENGRGIEARSTLTWGQKAMTCHSATNQVDIDIQSKIKIFWDIQALRQCTTHMSLKKKN